MIVEFEWDGTNRPFEGEVSIPIHTVPDGARLRSAKVRVTPVDPGNSFVETVSFSGSGPRWGANKVQGANFVEVDFRGRRTLAAVRGSAASLNLSSLQIDPGGTYVEINENGAIRAPGDNLFQLPNQPEVILPSFTAARFKLTRIPAPDLSSVNVRSVPENVSLRLGDNPPFHTFLGPLTEPETSVNFAALLDEFLADAELVNGYYTVPLVVHSDTIARLKLRIALDILESHDVLPAGVDESVLSYSFNAVPAAAVASLPLSLTLGARVVAGETSVRLLGSFDETRIAFGPVVPVQSGLEVEIAAVPGHPEAQAQPFALPEPLGITGLDLLVRATSVAAQVQVDLRDDLGGKPGLNTLLPAPLILDLASKPSGKAEWVSAALPSELKLQDGATYWLIVQRSLGNAAWSTQPTSELGLQQTKDGGLSWRASDGGAVAGYFRLRNHPAHFTMPVHVFAGEGDAAEEVPLGAYESLGRVDFTLDSDEFAAAINKVLESSASRACLPVEHLDNRDFQDWLRVGDAPSPPQVVGNELVPRAMALSPDGRVLYVLDQVSGARLQVVDPVCLDTAPPLELPESVEPNSFGSGLTVTGDGTGLVAHLNGRTWFVDLATNTLLGQTDDPQLATNAMAADGQQIYFVSGVSSTAGFQIRRVAAESLRNHIVSGSPLSVETVVSLAPGLSLAGLAVSADGSWLYVALAQPAGADGSNSLRLYDTTTRSLSKEIPLSFMPSGLAIHPEAPVAYVGDADSPIVRWIDLVSGAQRGTLAPHTVGDGFGIARLSTAALSPAYLAVAVNRPDLSDVLELFGFGIPVPEVWQVTSGQVSPFCLGEPFRTGALLGVRSEGGSPASSLSQVVPVSGGCPYEFSFWGIAEADGAAGEVLWRNRDCLSPRSDSVPIRVLERPGNDRETKRIPSLNLQFHRLRLTAPEGATAAEVRFRTTFDVRAVVDRVSLATVSPLLQNMDFLELEAGALKGWTLVPPAPVGFVIHADPAGVEMENNGIETIAVFQEVHAEPDSTLRIEFSGEVSAAGSRPFLLLEWSDSSATPATVLLEPESPRFRVATINVPPDSSIAEFSIQLPAGSRLKMDSLRVTADARVAVPINVYAEAPGELSISDIRIVTDAKPPAPPPLPPEGLCPPTKPGADSGGEECSYCPCCGDEYTPSSPQLALTPTRRHAVRAVCTSCGSVVLRPLSRSAVPIHIAAAPAVRAIPVRPLVMLRRPVAELSLKPAVRSPVVSRDFARPVTAVSLRAVLGMRRYERDKLEASGIRSVEKLAETKTERVAEILEEADSKRAETLISLAKKLLTAPED